MLGYDAESFHQYFSRAWITDPTDGLYKQVGEVNVGAGTVILTTVEGHANRVKLDDIGWKHVAIPENMGYRNNGKHLYYVTMKVGRSTRKAVQDNTTAVFTVQQIEDNMGVINAQELNSYRRGATISAAMIKALTSSKFISMEKAVNSLMEGDDFGFALCPSTAIVLSNTKEFNLDLLFQRCVAASSVDGKRWKLRNEHLLDPLTRAIGKLNYVD